MKIGAVLTIYLIFGIWTSTNRISNVLMTIACAIIICLMISFIGRLICYDRMVSFWQRWMKNLIALEIIGIVTMLTWGPLLRLIF